VFCWGFILLEIKVSFELTQVQGFLFQPIVPRLVLVRVKKHSHQAIIYLVTLPALVIPLLGSLIYFNLKDQSQLVQIIYGLVKVYTFLWPALAVFVLLKLPWSHLRGYFRLDAKMAKEGAICGFLMGSVILLTLLTPWGDLVRNQAEMVRQKATDMGIIRFFSRLCSLYFHWAQLAGRILLEMVRLWTAASLFSQSMDGSPNGRGRFCRTSFRGDHDLLCWSDGLVLRVLCWGSWGGLVMVDGQASVHTRCLACPHVGRSLLDGGWLLAHLFCGTSKLNMSPWA
jgi:hypothetical protein